MPVVPLDASLARRVTTLCGGLVLIAAGVACAIGAELGVAPYDVLTTGLADLLSIPIGLAAFIVPTAFVALAAILGSRLSWGTGLCVVLIGPMLGLILDRLPHAEAMAPRVGYFLGGFLLITVGVSLTIVTEIGSGPVELVMLALHQRGIPLAPARTAVELTSVGAGWLIGGQVGVGTLVFAALLGPTLRRELTFFGFDAQMATEASDRAGARSLTMPAQYGGDVAADDDLRNALQRVTDALPAGEARPGQVAMAEAVAVAIRQKRHLAVQAGTGTGKTLGYLVPALLAGRKTIVATATKALQDQLASKDLPFLQRHLGTPFDWAVLKGRSNYLCMQRLSELAARDADGAQLAFDGVADRAPKEELVALAAWADTTATGDRAELAEEPSDWAWAAVSVSARECPGASRCPSGDQCFAEDARQRAVHADVVVVNLHLYGLDLASGGVILPEHDLVIIDEAHQLEDIVSATSGVELTAGRFTDLARRTRGVIADDQLPAGVDDAGRILTEALRPHRDRRLKGRLPDDLAGARTVARGRVELVLSAARSVPSDAPEESRTRALRLVQSASALIEDLEVVEQTTGSHVVWVEGLDHSPVLRVAPLDVAGLLHDTMWAKDTAVVTSATLPARLPARLGVEDGRVTELDVGSPFDYGHQALLYCAAHLPDPRNARYLDALADEMVSLIEAAGGRTLALFTSFRVLDEMATRLVDRIDLPILTQRQMPKARLLELFSGDEATSLFATMGFWQGVDVPGSALSLVIIDRIPFPRPDEPLLQARRERLGADLFAQIDLPRAATLLAQGSGRLIRSSTDRGVVAVLDPRLATASYRWDMVRALPPMRRTKDPEEARAMLRAIRDDEPTPATGVGPQPAG